MSAERVARRRRRRRWVRGLGATGIVLLAIAAIHYVGGKVRSSPSTTEAAVTTTSAVSATLRRRAQTTLGVQARRVGTLTSAIQDAAAAPASADGGSIALLAGLSASDLSTNAIRVANAHADRTTGTLP